MKSRINPRLSIRPRLIGYCICDGKKAALSEIAAENNIDIRFAGAESAGESVGYLAGINGFKPSDDCPENAPEREVLIMAGLKSTVMDRVLKALREKNSQIELKCAVTAINQSWKICGLIEELEKEHEAMLHQKTEIGDY